MRGRALLLSYLGKHDEATAAGEEAVKIQREANGSQLLETQRALAELYTIPQDHLDFRDTIRRIAQERVAPRAAEIDERAEYPHDLRELLSEHGLRLRLSDHTPVEAAFRAKP